MHDLVPDSAGHMRDSITNKNMTNGLNSVVHRDFSTGFWTQTGPNTGHFTCTGPRQNPALKRAFRLCTGHDFVVESLFSVESFQCRSMQIPWMVSDTKNNNRHGRT